VLGGRGRGAAPEGHLKPGYCGGREVVSSISILKKHPASRGDRGDEFLVEILERNLRRRLSFLVRCGNNNLHYVLSNGTRTPL